MTLTIAEISYLRAQRLGRLATIQPDGSPQVKPVGFRYHPELGTIDINEGKYCGARRQHCFYRIFQAPIPAKFRSRSDREI